MTNHALAKKLGLKMGMCGEIAGPPPGYLTSLGPYLDGVDGPRFVQRFVASKAELLAHAPSMTKDETALVWVTYPKKTSGMESDLSREVVRDVMSELG